MLFYNNILQVIVYDSRRVQFVVWQADSRVYESRKIERKMLAN